MFDACLTPSMPEQSQHQQAPLALSMACPHLIPPGVPPTRSCEKGRGQGAEDLSGGWRTGWQV